MIRQKRCKKGNRKTNTFIGLWMDNNSNETFGLLSKVCKTKSEIILEILRDLTTNEYIEPEKLKEYESILRDYNELSIPEIINYKIACI